MNNPVVTLIIGILLLAGGLWVIYKGIRSIQASSWAYCRNPARYRLLGWSGVVLASGMLIAALNTIINVTFSLEAASEIREEMTATSIAMTATREFELLHPTPDLETLLDDASLICDQAFVSDITAGEIAAPMLSLIKSNYKGTGWKLYSDYLPHIGARSAGEMRTLICIQSSRRQDGTYTDGSFGYQLTWKVRVVVWPAGSVLSEQTWEGESSPAIKKYSGDAYGRSPDRQLMSWLYDQVKISSIIIPLEDIDQISPTFAWTQLVVRTPVFYDHCSIWDIHSRTVQFEHDFKDLYEMAVSPARLQIALSTLDGAVSLWDPSTDDIEILKDSTGEMYVHFHLAYSPDGKILARWNDYLDDADDSVLIWDVTTHQLLHTLVGLSTRIKNLVFSPDSKHLALDAGYDTVKILEVATGSLEQTLPDSGPNLAFSTDGAKLIVFGDSDIKIWEFASAQALRSFEYADSDITVYSPQAELLAAGEEVVELWNTLTGEKIHTFDLHTGEITAIAFSPDGNRLASGDDSGAIFLWDTRTGERIMELIGHSSTIRHLQFSPDGRTLLSWSYDDTIRFWDISGK